MKTERGLRFELENVSEEDARFIAEVLALFTDPARAQDLAELKGRLMTIGYHTVTGEARFLQRFGWN